MDLEAGVSVRSMAFTRVGGKVTWDASGVSTPVGEEGTQLFVQGEGGKLVRSVGNSSAVYTPAAPYGLSRAARQFHLDALGSVQAVSASGYPGSSLTPAVTQTYYGYDAFGNVVKAGAVRFTAHARRGYRPKG